MTEKEIFEIEKYLRGQNKAQTNTNTHYTNILD